jgi:hypothetical protein
MAFNPPRDYDNYQELRLYFNGQDLCYVEPISEADFENSKRKRHKLEYFDLEEVPRVEQEQDMDQVQNMENANSLSKRSEKTFISVGVSVGRSVCTHWVCRNILGTNVRICTRWEDR